jgi:hypothetical protein
MTQPVPHGYPDFGRYSARADLLLTNQQNVAVNVDTNYVIGFVGGIEALGVSANSNGTGALWHFDYFSDDTYTLLLSRTSVETGSNRPFEKSLPTYGPFLRITLSPNAAGSTYTLVVWSTTQFAISNNGQPQRSVLIGQTTVNIAAGATSTFTAARVWPGGATWTVTGQTTGFRATLSHLSRAAVATVMDSIQRATLGTEHHQLFLPARVIEVAITNTSAGAANFDTYVTARNIITGL